MQKDDGICRGRPLQSSGQLLSLFERWSDIACRSLILCTVLFFAGCTTLTHKNNIVTTVVTEPVVGAAARSANFGLIGRVSVKGGKESFSGGVQWHHTEDADEILLLSPLGQTLVQIQHNSEGVYLTTSEQESHYAADVESLTERILGWRLPLAGLQYWVQSMNSPATASEMDVGIDGHIAAIRQDGWEISYLSYFPMLKTQTTQVKTGQPKLLMLKRSNLHIKLVIDNWNPDN